MKVLIATEKPFAREAINSIREVIEEAGYELVLLEKYAEKEQLLEAVKNADAAIIRSDIFDEEVLSVGKHLKIVVRAGAGYDNVNLEAAKNRNIVVMNTPGQNANAVAELVFGLAVYATRNFFNGTSGNELFGKKLGIHAYGNVGRNVARIAKGFGMEIYAYDPFLDKNTIEAEGVKSLSSVEELYATCQFISVHIPATPQTQSSINFDLLQKMPHNGVLINTARKEVVHEQDMLRLLAERTDIKYVTDIKPGNDRELKEKFPNRYFSTPKKMGAQTAEANIKAGIAAAKQIVDFFQTGNEQFRVNK